MAGSPPGISKRILSNELIQAGVPLVNASIHGECNSPVKGLIKFEDGNEAELTRLWYYWEVNLKSPMPEADAKALNKDFSEEVRVNGFAGGMQVESPVKYWHVDTQEGLNTLINKFFEIWGLPQNGSEVIDFRIIKITGLHYKSEECEVHTIELDGRSICWVLWNNYRVPVVKGSYSWGGEFYEVPSTVEKKEAFLENAIIVIEERLNNGKPLNKRQEVKIAKKRVDFLMRSDYFSSELVTSSPCNWQDMFFASDLNDKYLLEKRDEYKKELQELRLI